VVAVVAVVEWQWARSNLTLLVRGLAWRGFV